MLSRNIHSRDNTKHTLALVATVFLCGLVFANSTRDRGLTIRFLILAVSTFAIALTIYKMDLSILSRWIFPVSAGYCIAIGLSSMQAINASEAYYELCRSFVLLCFMVVCSITIKKDVLIKSVAILGLVYGIMGASQSILIAKYLPDKMQVYSGMMCNKNLWASAMLLVLPFCLYCLKYNKFWKTVGIAGSTGIVIAIFVMMTRSVVLALLISSFVVLLFTRFRWYAVAVAVIGVIVVCMAWPTLDKTSLNERFELWTGTAEIVKDNPLYGVGAGNWQLVAPNYLQDVTTFRAFDRVYFRHPHNDYIWVLSETGLFGFVLYLSMFGLALYYAIRTKNLLVIGGITAYMVYAFFSFPKERPFHCMMLMIYFALAIKNYHIPARVKQIPHIFKYVTLAGMLFCVCAMSCRHGDAQLLKLAREKRLADADFAKVSCFSTIDLTSTPIVFWKGLANYEDGNIEQASKDFLEAYRCNPNHVHVLRYLGKCFIHYGMTDEAIKCNVKILRIKGA